VVPAGATPSGGMGAVRYEPILQTIVDLRSGDPARVRAVLAEGTLTPATVPHALPLLAWDEMADLAVAALRRVARRVVGQLVDALVDPEEEFAIRRRLPRVLSFALTPRAVEGLMTGLSDRRFEVRFQCGRGLAYMLSTDAGLAVERERIFEAVLQEARVDRRVWESHRLLDKFEDEASELVLDEYLRERSNRSLEHVFTMLSLVLPKQPLILAYRGLHTDDVKLRGTALEYLESVLPPTIRDALWPFLEADGRQRPGAERDRDEILNELMRSNKSIQLNLEALRQRFEGGRNG
jgi:ATP:ADP antiporter, AAA family